MPDVELKNQSLRIRMQNPKKFKIFRVHDVGLKGRLQRVAGYSKKLGWQTQSWRLNLSTYEDKVDAINELKSLKDYITMHEYNKAKNLVERYFDDKRLG